MKRITLALLLALAPACAHFAAEPPPTDNVRQELWHDAHMALYGEDFAGAQARFEQLTERFPDSAEGREALFFLGVVRMDPRNPDWNPEPAVGHLRSYLTSDTLPESAAVIPRPEARTLLQLAEQLTLPAGARVPGLQPETRVVRVQTRVVAPASESRALAGEVERLRREVAERDDTIRQQREELDRIRDTLTPRPR